MAALDVRPDGAAGAADLAVACDVSSEDSVTAAMDRRGRPLGPIDVLVNNAGITGSRAATVCHETPVQDWDQVHAVNVRGPFLCSRAVLPSMVARGRGSHHHDRLGGRADRVPRPVRLHGVQGRGGDAHPVDRG